MLENLPDNLSAMSPERTYNVLSAAQGVYQTTTPDLSDNADYVLYHTGNSFSIIMVSTTGTTESALWFIGRYLSQYGVKIAGSDICIIHRDSNGGAPYLTNKTGTTMGFYVKEFVYKF